MRTAILSFAVSCLLSTAVPARGQEPAGLPVEPGVYVRVDTTKWVKLTEAPAADSRIRGMNVFVETGGQTNLDMTFVFSGAKAGVQLAERRPVFYVRRIGDPKEALIVKLETGSSKRTAKASHKSASTGNKAGFRSGDIRPVTTAAVAPGVFSVSPSDPLKPGEYFLTFGATVTVFDFGIERGK